MLAVERTYPLRLERRWLPRRVRRTASLVRGALLVGGGAATAGAVVAAPLTIFFWKVMVLGGAGIAVASRRAGHVALQRQIRRMTRGEIELADVFDSAEGEMVVVRGTICADHPLQGVLLDAEGVYRRLELKVRRTWVHEAAVNFSLIDERGERIVIEAGGARWLVPPREKVTYPAARFSEAHVSPRVRELVAGFDSVEAFEQVLSDGEAVQVVGYKSTTIDPTGAVSDYRSPPRRATLRSGPDLPLVIIRTRDLET